MIERVAYISHEYENQMFPRVSSFSIKLHFHILQWQLIKSILDVIKIYKHIIYIYIHNIPQLSLPTLQ